jgi:hypothetical protein
MSASRVQTPGERRATVKAQRIPVEQTFSFEERAHKVKIPPEIRQEINYSKQRSYE